MHHLDIPWRPADLQQRDGRAVRKGNKVKLWGNNTVDVVIYGTEKTLDAYKFNLLKNKQAFMEAEYTSTMLIIQRKKKTIQITLSPLKILPMLLLFISL